MDAYATAKVSELVRDLAACRTFEELTDTHRDEWVKPFPLDELILRARDLVDTLGLNPERPTHPVSLPW